MALDWSAESTELFGLLFPLVRQMTLDGVAEAIAGLPDAAQAGVDWALVNEQAAQRARTHALELVDDMTGTSREKIREAIAGWIESGKPLSALEDALEPWLGEMRADLVAATEATAAFAAGNWEAWDASGVVEGMRWQTVRDDLVCEICAPLHNMEVDLHGDGFNPTGGEGIPYPPAHVRCRCYTVPVVRV